MNDMSGLILAAGRGSRMQSLTDARPKALIEIAGRPVLDWTLAALRSAGVKDVLVVRGYLGHMLAGPYATVDNPRWQSSNMVVSLLHADEWLTSGPTLVAYADILFRGAHAAALAATNADLAITYDRRWLELWSRRFADPLDDAETFREEDGWLIEIGQRTRDLSAIAGQYMGLLKITPAGWGAMRAVIDALPPDAVDRLDMTSLLKRLLNHSVRIAAVPVDGGWCEIDSADDLRLYDRCLEEAAASGIDWSHDWR